MNYQYSIIGELVADVMSSSLFDALAKIPVTGMALNSRQLKPGWLFIALKGEQEHGMDYLAAAQQAGACAALVDERDITRVPQLSLPLIPVRNLVSNLTRIADRFYGGGQLEWSGVTGTNGKSSIVHLLAQALSACGIKTAAIGTVYQGFPAGEEKSGFLTTPDPITLRRLRADLYQEGARHLLVEASSHALAQDRLRDIKLTTGIMTNITQEHQDYHKNLKSYVAAKRRLFALPSLQYGIFNLDDGYGRKWFAEVQGKIHCFSYSLDNSQADIYAEDMDLTIKGAKACIRALGERCRLRAAILGPWQLTNMLASLAVLLIKKIPLRDAVAALSQAQGLRGRMQAIRSVKGVRFFVDYAHTPDALRQVLSYLRAVCQGNLWVVFGCGGERDSGKRAIMGEVAAEYAARIVLTNDNPRGEDPTSIIHSIQEGIKQDKEVHIEMDRAAALEWVMQEAGPKDLVLVAGKGHERVQTIGGKNYPFNDYDYLARRLNHAG